MNNKWMESFAAVAKEGSVNAAARTLYISPQALLQQINLMETEIGTKLFFRHRSGMELTLAGKEFLNGLRQITSIYEQTLSRCRLASQAQTTIRIPMMNRIIRPEFMEAVCIQYRRTATSPMRIEFVADENFGSWLEGLKNLKYDIIEHFSIDGRCPQGIHFEYLSDVRSWCIMAEYHPLAGCRSIRPEDLAGHTLLSPGNNMQLMRYLQMHLEASDIQVEMRVVENERYQIMEGLNRGDIYIANEDIAQIFVGYIALPLDFNTHVQHGFACREEMREIYKPFFEVAHVQNNVTHK